MFQTSKQTELIEIKNKINFKKPKFRSYGNFSEEIKSLFWEDLDLSISFHDEASIEDLIEIFNLKLEYDKTGDEDLLEKAYDKALIIQKNVSELSYQQDFLQEEDDHKSQYGF